MRNNGTEAYKEHINPPECGTLEEGTRHVRPQGESWEWQKYGRPGIHGNGNGIVQSATSGQNWVFFVRAGKWEFV